MPQVKQYHGFRSASRRHRCAGGWLASRGGCLISVHEPAVAEAWVENNYDSLLLKSIRNKDIGGPLAVMLYPNIPALAIFGSYEDTSVQRLAQRLVEVSSFPVMIRALLDNPVPKL